MDAKISLIEGTNLLSMMVNMEESRGGQKVLPGSHIYIQFPQLNNKTRINPFTLAQVPNQDREAQLIIRTLSGTTALLHQLAEKPQPCPVIVEGPYGAAKYFPNLHDYQSILFVAGGVGATFTLPVYQSVLTGMNQNGDEKNIRFIWAIRKEIEAQWGLKNLSRDSRKLPKGFELYVTGLEETHSAGIETRKDDDIEIELEERHGLLRNVESSFQNLPLAGSADVKRGRPPLHRLVDQFFAHVEDDKVAVLVCGPKGLGAALRKEVGRWVEGERHIFWHNEDFGW